MVLMEEYLNSRNWIFIQTDMILLPSLSHSSLHSFICLSCQIHSLFVSDMFVIHLPQSLGNTPCVSEKEKNQTPWYFMPEQTCEGASSGSS